MKRVLIITMLLAAWFTPTLSQKTAAPKTGRPPAQKTAGGSIDLTRSGKPISQVGVGDIVWAKWTDGFHYIAAIHKISGENLTVNYADGNQREVSRADLVQFEIKAGMVLQCKWSKGGFWPAKVLTVSPSFVEVEFLDDQSREKHTAADLRFKPRPYINLSQNGKPIDKVGVGDVVWGRWGDGFYYIGNVVEVNGKKLHNTLC